MRRDYLTDAGQFGEQHLEDGWRQSLLQHLQQLLRLTAHRDGVGQVVHTFLIVSCGASSKTFIWQNLLQNLYMELDWEAVYVWQPDTCEWKRCWCVQVLPWASSSSPSWISSRKNFWTASASFRSGSCSTKNIQPAGSRSDRSPLSDLTEVTMYTETCSETHPGDLRKSTL